MNVFEDLIEELKEENLLEATIVAKNTQADSDDQLEFEQKNAPIRLGADEILEAECIEPEVIRVDESSYFEDNVSPIVKPEEAAFVPDNSINGRPSESYVENKSSGSELQVEGRAQENASVAPKKQVNQMEFFRQRATNEVLALQMVEHVLSGVERDILNLVPKLYNELPVKKALHDFIQISSNVNSPEHAQAEFQLMQETESWYSALTRKDKNINVGHLRRYCETTRPALSSQALISLARFYRNAPYSESVRSKFDLIITRLFTREVGDGKRLLAYNRDELIRQLNAFYAEWSSIQFYPAEEDDSQVVLAALKIEDFMTEADNAKSFDELLDNDFYNRLKIFKESTQEIFFAPLLAATFIECNIRTGNRYIELLEKEKSNAEKMVEKYNELHDQMISDIVCKTIQIGEILKVKIIETKPQLKPVVQKALPEKAPEEIQLVDEKTPPSAVVETKGKENKKLFKINKWLALLMIFTIILTVGLYIWVLTLGGSVKSTNVKNVNLENSSLKEHIETARLSSDTFYGIVLPSWDTLSREEKEGFLRKILLIGNEKGFVRVNLLNRQGDSVGYATPEKVEVINP